MEFLRKLDATTGEEKIDLRARIKAKIQQACRVRVWTYGRGLTPVCLGVVEFANGQPSRLLAVKVERTRWHEEVWAWSSRSIPADMDAFGDQIAQDSNLKGYDLFRLVPKASDRTFKLSTSRPTRNAAA